MARSFLLIGAVVISHSGIGIADFDSSNADIGNFTDLTGDKDIVINAVHDYIQEHEKRLTTLRKHFNDYSKDHEKAIRKVAQAFSGAIQESSADDDDEILKEAKDFDNQESSYEKLCNGEIFLPVNIQKELKCRYVDRGMPFLKIAPFKEEEVYLDPRLVVYHDLIYEVEIEAFKRLSKPRLKSARLRNVITNENELSDVRIAKNAWLHAREDKHVKIVNRRVEHLTGLTGNTAEPLQIAYYDVGGLYLPHHDFVTKEDDFFFRELRIGDRIATVLFYMNDVAKGGGTVFPELNVTLWPKKGSAAFWYNLKRNGEGDWLTLHGACPLLSGTKWIATKWMHEVGQELIRPCSLLENE